MSLLEARLGLLLRESLALGGYQLEVGFFLVFGQSLELHLDVSELKRRSLVFLEQLIQSVNAWKSNDGVGVGSRVVDVARLADVQQRDLYVLLG